MVERKRTDFRNTKKDKVRLFQRFVFKGSSFYVVLIIYLSIKKLGKHLMELLPDLECQVLES